jgi:hypothetical protein
MPDRPAEERGMRLTAQKCVLGRISLCSGQMQRTGRNGRLLQAYAIEE